MRWVRRFRSLGAALALGGVSSGVSAGGDFEDEPRIARVTTVWARQGAGAMPAQIRPCGPGREELKAALGACCRLAFPAGAPAWCTP